MRVGRLQIAAVAVVLAVVMTRPPSDFGGEPDAPKNGRPESPAHWAYQPITRPAPPQVAREDWTRNAIDRFVLAKLEASAVTPSSEADRTTLIKRLYYDLVGLPPTLDEVDAYLNDVSPDAYERLVDRLLGSPRFGERWGRHWLDKARYADSDGYEKDNPRPDAWRYRDWVIEAVNADMPFDRFTIEQFAGDLLSDATPATRLATAFQRQTLTNTEGGVDQEQFRFEAMFDRVNTTGTVWLGLTLGCAQCHSHKYDAVSQNEYYQLLAFFNNGDESETEVPISDEEVARYEREKLAFEPRLKELESALAARRAEVAPSVAEWEREAQAKIRAEAASPLQQHALEVVRVASQAGVSFQRLDDGSFLAGGANPEHDQYTIVAKTRARGVTGFRIDVLADESLPSKGPGRVEHGNFVLSEFRVHAAESDAIRAEHRVTLAAAKADFSQEKWQVAGAIDGKPETGWAVAPQFGKNHWATFKTEGPVQTAAADGATWLQIELEQRYGKQHTIGRFRLSAVTGVEPDPQIPEDVRKILAVPPDQRDEKQVAVLLDHVVARDEKGKELQRQIEELKKQAPKSPLMKVRVLAQRSSDPRQTHLLRRGDFLQPQAEVQPGTLAALHPLKSRRADAPPDRLDLARWLVDPANPLTPRVAVNQVWAHLFGAGIVRTMTDFGVRGEQPSHPELLDWLAHEFMRHDWSRKAIIRAIATSATYRQSSTHGAELAQIDPENKLLARQNRFRVEAETVRDLTLAVSGLLVERIGGASVYPPMHPDVAALSYADNFKWTTSPGADRYRRGMYTFFKRTAPHPNLSTFDCPDSNTTTVLRRTSNTPLQALTALNNEVFVEAAQSIAKRLLERSDLATDGDRLSQLFRLCTARAPSDRERQRFVELLDAARAWYKERPDDAKAMIGNYQPAGVAVPEAAAWAATTRIVLNLDEFLTRE